MDALDLFERRWHENIRYFLFTCSVFLCTKSGFWIGKNYSSAYVTKKLRIKLNTLSSSLLKYPNNPRKEHFSSLG